MSPDCLFKNIELQFGVSRISVSPIGLQLDQDPKRDKDDLCQVELTDIAASHVLDRYVDREPVAIVTPKGTLWRGWIAEGDVSIGETTGSIHLRDPLTILEDGQVDKQWAKTTLREAGEYIFDQVYDTHGVVSDIAFPGDSGEVVRQHKALDFLDQPLETTLNQFKQNFEESDMGRDHDGRFDFRGEDPRAAFTELCNVFKCDLFVRPDGTLVLGQREFEPNIYSAGVDGSLPWTIKGDEFSFPDYNKPFGAVAVRGNPLDPAHAVFEGDIEDKPTRFMKSMTEASSWALAEVAGHEGPVTKLQAKGQHTKGSLAKIAVNKLITQIYEDFNGEVTVTPIRSTQDSPASTVGHMKYGDLLAIDGDPSCGVPTQVFRILSIHHDLQAGEKWDIQMEIVPQIVNSIQVKTGSYNALSPEQNVGGTRGFLDSFMEGVDAGLEAFKPFAGISEPLVERIDHYISQDVVENNDDE